MNVYQLNLKGFSPAYYYSKKEAFERYCYCKRYFSRCSLRRISYEKMLSKVYGGK